MSTKWRGYTPTTQTSATIRGYAPVWQRIQPEHWMLLLHASDSRSEKAVALLEKVLATEDPTENF